MNSAYKDLNQENGSGENLHLAGQLYGELCRRNWSISTAESCTGGELGALLTEISGISWVYPGGFITYSVQEKHRMLGVPMELLNSDGAVSTAVAAAMAKGAAERTGTETALSVTGNAGPLSSEGKPVGLVYTGCFVRGQISVQEFHFCGSRKEIRRQAVEKALQLLLQQLEKETI